MASIDAAAIQCKIDVVHENGSVSLRGRVVSSTAISGNYRLEIQSRGPSGSSDVSQAGTFIGKPGAPVFVGLTTLSMASRTRLMARLIVWTADAQSCRAERVVSEE